MMEDGDIGKDASEQDNHSAARLACDQCRIRKVGCDRQSPCSSCVRAKIECRFTSKLKPLVKRQRVHVSAEYEKKLDTIEERLNEVINLLKHSNGVPSNDSAIEHPERRVGHEINAASSSIATPESRDNPSVVKLNTNNYPSLAATPQTLFEGDSSLTAHAAFTNNILESAFNNGPFKDFKLEMGETLAGLRAIVDAQNKPSTIYNLSYPTAPTVSPYSPSPKERALPSMELSMTTLRMVKDDPRLPGGWLACFLPTDKLIEHALKVFFPGDFSDADFIIVNGSLYGLFMDRINIETDPGVREDLERNQLVCQVNLETALSCLPLHLLPSLDNLIALILGAWHGLDMGKPAICSVLTTAAVQISQTLGFNKIQSMKNDTASVRNQKIWAFWVLYMMDKSLSLRFGRSSLIQDSDISVPEPELMVANQPTVVRLMAKWVKVSRIQGRVYDQLYSQSGLSEPSSVRASRANALASEIKSLIAANNDRQVFKDEWDSLVLGQPLGTLVIGDEIFLLSVLTLILRAIPVPGGSPVSFCEECIVAARATLDLHQSCMPMLKSDTQLDVYIKQTLLYTPFTPFFILFCHVIDTSDQSDLERLHAFVISFQKASKLSDASVALQRLTQVLFNIALRYVELKARATSNTSEQFGREFDEYFHALGLVPTSTSGGVAGSSMAYAGTEGLPHVSEDSSYVADWFHSNQQLMGLLEDNYFQIPESLLPPM